MTTWATNIPWSDNTTTLEIPGMLAADVPYTGDGAMVCCYPTGEQAAALAQPGGQDADSLHCTLIHFRELPDDLTDVLYAVAMAASSTDDLSGTVSAAAAFPAGEDGHPVVALLDVPDLGNVRAILAGMLDAAQVTYSTEHGFTPHITLAYDASDDPALPEVQGVDVTFDALYLVTPTDTVRFPLDPTEEDGMGAAAAITAAEFTEKQRERLAEEGEAMPDGSFPIRNTSDLRNAISSYGRAKDPQAAKAHIIKRARALDATDELPDDWTDDSEETEPVRAAITAAAAGLAPEVPPGDWFQDPGLSDPTPLTITSDGRVYGHAALWGTCHTGVAGTCVTPPRSASGYRYYMLGSRDTTDGEVAVGRITAGTGHASLNASKKQAVAHYDDTGMVVAHVAAGEDEHGIWIAGALDPDADAARVRTLKAASVSGDWRTINGQMEMVGLLAVNVPGFPIPRTEARVASGVPVAMVAAGIVETILADADYARRMKLLAARALGEEELVDLALGTTPTEKRMRTMRPAPRPAAAVEVPGTNVTININVGEQEEDEELPELTAAMEREVGMQLDYFRTHQTWPDAQLGGDLLDGEEMRHVVTAATLVVTEPERTRELRARLIERGFVIDAGTTAPQVAV